MAHTGGSVTFESLPFYRGISASHSTDRPFVAAPRSDRRPRNSSKVFHEIADAWFLRKFGIPYRSAGLFVTASLEVATAYAATPQHVARIVPISSYRYCWSPTVSDLLYAQASLKEVTTSSVEALLDAASYLETGLEGASDKGHEVMLACDQYVAIPVGILGMSLSSLSRGLILPCN